MFDLPTLVVIAIAAAILILSVVTPQGRAAWGTLATNFGWNFKARADATASVDSQMTALKDTADQEGRLNMQNVTQAYAQAVEVKQGAEKNQTQLTTWTRAADAA